MANRPNHFIMLILSVLSTTTYAQTKPTQPSVQVTATSNSTNVQQPPKSGLGKQVSAAQQLQQEEIALPKASEVVEQAIGDIESTQLTDPQYKRLKEIYLRRERQKVFPYTGPAKPVTRTQAVNLEPGVPPPMLRLAQGQLTSVVFSDNSGQPWMISDVRLNRKLFSDGQAEGGQSAGALEPTNILTIEPVQPTAYGNVSVRLKGLPTPVIFMLSGGQQEVDLRVDAKVPGRNPDALEAVNYTSPPSIDVSLTAFLDGVPPKEAKRLQVSGLANTDAWMYQENLYIRTDADAHYPAYYSSARSTSGKAVFRFVSRQNSVTLLSNGRAVTVFIDE